MVVALLLAGLFAASIAFVGVLAWGVSRADRDAQRESALDSVGADLDRHVVADLVSEVRR